MGMDVYGMDPSKPEGEYFRNNVWWWRPLWDYCYENVDVAQKVVYGHSNDGDGLGAEDSVVMADVLDALIRSGHTEEWKLERDKEIENIPLEECDLCQGKGYRTDDIVKKMPHLGEPGGCNKCHGHGKVLPWDAHYPFSVENVQEFANFCRYSGGFQIC
jgi:hypothetical protein